MAGFTAKPRAKGASKQFSGGGGRTPFTATPKQATASMQGKAPPPEGPAKTITKAKGARKNNVRGGGKSVF